MKCPKCGYTSFDHLQECKKCSVDLTEHKSRFSLRSIFLPGNADLAAEPAEPAAVAEAMPATEPDISDESLTASEPEPGELPLDDLLGSAAGAARHSAPAAAPAEEMGEPVGEVEENAALPDDFLAAEPAPEQEWTEAGGGEFPPLADEVAGGSEFLDLDLDLSYGSLPGETEPAAAGSLEAAETFSLPEDLPALDDDTAFHFDAADPEDAPGLDGDAAAEREISLEADPAGPEEDAGPEPAAKGVREVPGDPFDHREPAGRAPGTEPSFPSRPEAAPPAVPAGPEELPPLSAGSDRLEFTGNELPPLSSGPPATTAWPGSWTSALEGEFAPPPERLPEVAAEPAFPPGEPEEPAERAAAPVGAAAPTLFGRTAATLTDFVILGILFVLFVLAAELALGGSRPLAVSFAELLIPYFLVFFSLCFGYFTLFHFLVGQTVGKMFFHLRVVTQDEHPPLFSQAFLRSTGGLVSLLAAGLGYLPILFDRQGRGWSDRLAGTRVILCEGVIGRGAMELQPEEEGE